jgi:S-adenosyl-L-methionine hydrolase (adenosine-forming)
MASVTRPIVFASDFGYRNEWVGICHAVMNRVAPASAIVDLSHGIPPLDVLAGALLVLDSLDYVAEDAVVVAVVDPSVGADRDLAIETRSGRILVGPDNGVLAPAWEALGGVRRAVEITASEVVLEPIAPSLHARDVLCPAAAHLASGFELEQLGPTVDPASLALLKVPEPEVEPGTIRCEVLDLNRFGNVQLNVRAAHLVTAGLDAASELAVEGLSQSVRASRANTYADLETEQYGVLFDPRGWLAVVRGNPGNAAEGLAVQVGDQIWISQTPNRDESPAA